MMNNIQEAETNKQREQIEAFYKAKYPDSIGSAVKPEPEQKLSAQELQEQNARFSDGIYRANQAQNADTMNKLAETFKSRKAGK